MPIKQQKIVIIGSGMAGYMLAMELRAQCKEVGVTVITEVDGAYYPKPKLSSALFNNMKPDELITHSKDAMETRYVLKVHANTRVESVDTHSKKVLCADGRSFTYDHCVLALGSRSKTLTCSKEENVLHSMTSLEEYRVFRKHLCKNQAVTVLGSGLVGIEAAHDLLSYGVKVSMLSRQEEPLAGVLPSLAGRRVKEHLQRMGLEWRSVPGGIQSCRRNKDGFVELTSAEGVFSANSALAALGVQARLELPKTMGLATAEGVLVDNYGRTSESCVWALGDCAECNGLIRRYVAPIRIQVKAMAKSLLGSMQVIEYPPLAAVLKTPSLPCVWSNLLPVSDSKERDWKVEHEGAEALRMGRYDQHGRLQGFVLLGQEALALKNSWLERL